MTVTGDVFTIRKNILNVVGATLKVYDEKESLIMVCRQKGFRLKEDIRTKIYF